MFKHQPTKETNKTKQMKRKILPKMAE